VAGVEWPGAAGVPGVWGRGAFMGDVWTWGRARRADAGGRHAGGGMPRTETAQPVVRPGKAGRPGGTWPQPFAAGDAVPRPVSLTAAAARRLRGCTGPVARSVTAAAVCRRDRRACPARPVPTAAMLHGNIRRIPRRPVPMPRVLLVNDTDKPIAELRQALADAGCEVLEPVATAGLLRAVQEQQPDVVILDVESPSRDTLEQLAMIDRHAPRPVVVFSADDDERLIRQALGAGVAAYVVDGLAPGRLASILRVAMARFEQQAHVRQRVDELEQRLQDRKDIERAKGLLIDRRGMSEAEAYATLRQQAMKQGLKLADVARRILAMADLLG